MVIPGTRVIVSGIRVVCAVLLLNLVVGCSVSTEQELQLGAANHQKFEQQSGGRYNDPQVQSYVNAVGMQMARLAGRPEMKWQFHVLASDQINAFAVPGGYIYITKGLLFRMTNEAQLAGVLGHEAGHIAGRHSAQQIERSQTVGILTAGFGIVAEQAGYAAAGDLGKVTSELYLLRYSRDHEKEADMLGLKYMTQAGYNPQGLVELMQILKTASGGKSSGGLGEWTSTHPDPGNRIEYLTATIRQQYAGLVQTGKIGEAEFKQNVLSRRKTALAPIDLSQPILWCGHCQEADRNARANVVPAGRELLVAAK
jgi:predicted Zn-dependent protease